MKKAGCLVGIGLVGLLLVVIVLGAIGASLGSSSAGSCQRSKPGEQPAFPSLIGRSAGAAQEELKCLGFTSVSIASATPGDTRAKDSAWLVVAQLPNPGSVDVQPAAPISLSISPSEDHKLDADTKDGACKSSGRRSPPESIEGIDSVDYMTYDVTIVNTSTLPSAVQYRIYFSDSEQRSDLNSVGPDRFQRWGGYSASGWLTTKELPPQGEERVQDTAFIRGVSGDCGAKLQVRQK